MGLHNETGFVLLKPAATVATPKFNKIHGTIIFARPFCIFNPPERGVDEHGAAGTQQRHHTAIAQAHEAITVPVVGRILDFRQGHNARGRAPEEFGRLDAPGASAEFGGIACSGAELKEVQGGGKEAPSFEVWPKGASYQVEMSKGSRCRIAARE